MKKLLITSILLSSAGAGVYFYTHRDKPLIDGVPNFMKPMGVRNNNPLNIRYSVHNNWQGQTGQYKGFVVFKSSIFGIRAAARLIGNYMHKNNLRTVKQIVNKWAPPTENKTSNYVKYVSKKMNVSENKLLSSSDILELIKAMITFENGFNPYSDSTIKKAIAISGVF